MQIAAQKANEIRADLDKLPQGFARTVVADYIQHLHPEHKKDLFQLIGRMLEVAPPKREGVLIPLEIA
jgi:hypothetical protein